LSALYEQYPSDVLATFTFDDNPRGSWRDGSVTSDDWGCGWLWRTSDHMGQVVERPLASWPALEDYEPPDPGTGAAGLTAMREAVRNDGHRHFVFADGGELFQRMYFLRGMENLLIDIAEDREELYRLRDLILQFCLVRIEMLLDTDVVDGIIFRDDWGTQNALLVSPESWRRVFRPAYERLVAAIHAGGAYASFHSDGVIEAIIPDMIEMGWDEINPQAHVMGIEELGRRHTGQVCFRADIDRQWTLPRGTPQDVVALIRRLFDAFGRAGGGYVGWGELAADVPLENGKAMLEALYGLRYAE
jgi:uroporphyrinogen decarboxylase